MANHVCLNLHGSCLLELASSFPRSVSPHPLVAHAKPDWPAVCPGFHFLPATSRLGWNAQYRVVVGQGRRGQAFWEAVQRARCGCPEVWGINCEKQNAEEWIPLPSSVTWTILKCGSSILTAWRRHIWPRGSGCMVQLCLFLVDYKTMDDIVMHCLAFVFILLCLTFLFPHVSILGLHLPKLSIST